MRILVVCYQIEPGKGSEAESGYQFVSNLCSLGYRLTVITRPNNARRLRMDPALTGVEVIGYDPPRWITSLKRGGRGILWFYYVWQFGVGRLVRRLQETNRFDVLHQYNFHTDWAPHFLRSSTARVVWGPICHQPVLPGRYLELEPVRGRLREWGKAATKRFFWNVDPNVRSAIRHSDVILFANSDVPRTYRRTGLVRYQTFGGAVAGQRLTEATVDEPFRLLHVGRSVSIKGGAVALDVLAAVRGRGIEATLTLVGDGPLRRRLVAKAERAGLSDCVRFLPEVERDQLREHYGRAHAFLYPSLGNQDTVVAEAMAAGLPVIGIAPSGTSAMADGAGVWATRRTRHRLVDEMADAVGQLAREARTDAVAWQRRQAAARERSEILSWRCTAAAIAKHYVR